MEELHMGHPGVCRMKSLARSVVWWPGIDRDLEEKVKKCQSCQLNQKTPAHVPLHPWSWPTRPWSRLHIDHAGPFLGHLFLIIVDAHSKWLEVKRVSSTSSQVTISVLRSVFATHGIPDTLMSDNGSAFTSAEFKEFTDRNGIQHLTSAPYHPSSNGLAERAVQTFKSAMKKMTSGDIDTRLARFLFQYRITPHTATGVSPAELLMGRKLQSHLDLLRPDVGRRVQRRQSQQKAVYDQHAHEREYLTDDPVYVRNHATQGERWMAGNVVAREGQANYQVKLQDNRVVRRHADQVRGRTNDMAMAPRSLPDVAFDDLVDSDSDSTSGEPQECMPETQQHQMPVEGLPNREAPMIQPRRSTRISRQPERLM